MLKYLVPPFIVLFLFGFSFDLSDKTLLAENKEADFKLYSKLNSEGDMYEGFYIEYKGRQCFFDYKNVTNPSFYPEVVYDDISGDGKKDLVVINTLGHGTGISAKEVRVFHEVFFDGEDFLREKLVESPIIAVHKSKTYQRLIKQGPVYVGDDQIYFQVVDHKLTAHVGARKNQYNIGDFTVTYQFKNDIYQLKSIHYRPSK
ncbi:hypothetical protein NDK43_22480 [Neobacillus pocheonensis]|uniref:VCBS repeat-containing protein n=1 Tax=Neobacillus pocheonensis TaxID=363869 RepID=A0ABT0WE53_9BACI|nr:hypothetical protein [Neobacillus pocheonensis]